MELALAVISVLVGIFIKDLLDLLPWLSRRIVCWRVKRIDKRYRERILRDFLADLDSMNSKIAQLIMAIGFLFQDWPEIPSINQVGQNPQELVDKDETESTNQ